MFYTVSRAPVAKLQAYKRRIGWTFPWASSHGSDFNTDLNVWFGEEQQRKGGIEYNDEREKALDWRGDEGPVAEMADTTGTDVATYTRERPGMSAFALENDVVTTPIPPMRVDWTPFGACANGSTAPPKGRNETAGVWWRRHDEIESRLQGAGPCCHVPQAHA